MTLSNPIPGHAPGLPAVTRRSVLQASPVLLVPALLAAPALAAAPDPLPAMLASCEAARQHWLATEHTHGDDSPEHEAAWTEFRRIEELIETTVATSPEGVAAQIRYMNGRYGSCVLTSEERPAVYDVPFAFLDVILEGLGRIGA